MKNNMKIKWKRFIAGALVLVMFLGLIQLPETEVQAAATNVTLSTGSALGPSDSNGRYNIFLGVSGADISSFSSDAAGNTVYLDGKPLTGGSKAVEYHLVSNELLLCVYYNVIEAGATTAAEIGTHSLVIPAGTVIGSGDTCYITQNDMGYYIDGTTIQQKQVVEFQTTATNVSQDFATRYQMWFSAPTGVLATGATEGTISATVDGNSATATWAVSGDNLLFLLSYSQVEAGATTASSIGSHTVTIPSGTVLSSGFMVKDTLTYTINGTTATPVDNATDMRVQQTCVSSNNTLAAGIYITTDALDGLAYDDGWNIAYTPTGCDGNFTLKKLTETMYFLDIGGAASAGQIVTFSGYVDMLGYRVEYAEASYQYTNGAWISYSEFDYTDVAITAISGTPTITGSNWFAYFTVDTTLPGDYTWDAGGTYTVNASVNGTDTALTVKKSDAQQLFMEIPTSLLAEDAQATVTIKEGKYNNSLFDFGINLTSDFTFYTDGANWGTTEYTNVTVTGFQQAPSYSGKWVLYLNLSDAINGGAWDEGGAFTVNLSVNGVSGTTTVKKADSKVLYLSIPAELLGENEDAVITIKAGKYKKSAEDCGFNLTKDFVAYASKYGWSTSDMILSSNVITPTLVHDDRGDTASAFYVETNFDDGVTVGDWAVQYDFVTSGTLTTDGQTWFKSEIGGVWDEDGNHVDATLYFKKLESKLYYAGTSVQAQTAGESYIVGGVLYDEEHNQLIDYARMKLTWNGSGWTQESIPLADAGLDADVNSDSEVDSRDLVRLKRHQDNELVSINEAREDINYDGNKNAYDVSSLRKVLLGMLYYRGDSAQPDVPYGTLIIDESKAIDKVAYSCPEIGTWAGTRYQSEFTPYSDEKIDEIFQEYKAAGFTMLNSEYVAELTDQAVASSYNDALRAYLNGAARNGLGVIVKSLYLEAILRADDLETTYPSWKTVMDQYVDYLSDYSAFRGFMMSDELGTTYTSNYQTIAGYLHETYPELVLFSSECPNYATGYTEEETYKAYADSFGVASGYFTYDNYALRLEHVTGDNIDDKNYYVEENWYTNLKWAAENSLDENGNQKYIPGITIQAFSMVAGESFEGFDFDYFATVTKDFYCYAPTEPKDIGFQVYTSLAWGMQSINYFCYEDHFDASQGIEDEMQVNSAVKSAVTSVNAEIKGLESVYKGFTWKQTLDSNDFTNGQTTSTGNERLASATVSGARTFIGCMKNIDGFDGYMIANAEGPRTSTEATVTLTFNNATSAIAYVDGEETPVELTNGACTFTVGVGEGVFVIPIRQEKAEDFVDFTVEVAEDEEPVVLQISDTQIIDASQDSADRLNDIQDAYYTKARIAEHCYDYLDELIGNTNPDLILVTGDLVYGDFDDDGSVFKGFVEYMESKKIPWAPVFGNHEAETTVTNGTASGIDVYCDWLEEATATGYCLFKQGNLTGNGNYTVGIKQGDEITRVFFMLDSNGSSTASAESLANKQTTESVGFGSDQIKWYTETAKEIISVSEETRFSFVFHIQLAAFADAYAKYGFTNSDTLNNPINIDLLDNQEAGDFGYLGRDLKSAWDTNYIVYNGLKELGVDSIFVGHEHCNSASVVYDGIRFQYGQKSSTCDRANYIDSTGEVIGAECREDLTPLVGGTVIPLTTDGSLGTPYIYMCGFENGVVDWDSYKEEDNSIAGLQFDGKNAGTNLYTTESTSTINVTADAIDGYNAWKVECASQSKVYVQTSLLEGKSTFSFSAYVPSTSTNTMQLTDYPIFAIRVKTSANSRPEFGNCIDGHICYSTTTSDATRLVTPGTWQTFTVDLTELDTSDCTEFAFYVGTGNTIYIKDVVIE